MSLKSSIRTVLTLGEGVVRGLPEAAEERDPIELASEWIDVAKESGILLPDSMALATATPDGVPSVRMILVKAVDERGFVFYTNFASRKSAELDENPRAEGCMHWAVLQRQLRVAGPVERISAEENEAYFATRPRGSQLGAWASKQSDTLPDRKTMEASFEAHRRKFEGEEIPLPSFWGGYRIRPERVEFWQGRADRLHDRLVFTREGDGWSTERLYP